MTSFMRSLRNVPETHGDISKKLPHDIELITRIMDLHGGMAWYEGG